MALQEIKGGAEPLQLLTDITNVSPSMVSSTTPTANWPTGVSPFVVRVRDTSGVVEEKMLVSSRSGTGFTILTRGYDGTLAVGHTAGEAIEHVASAVVVAEANAHVNTTSRDDHTQYLNLSRHDISGRHTFGGAFPNPATPTSIATANATGSGAGPARDDHTHMLPDGIVAPGKLAAGAVVAGNIAVGGISAANQFASAVVDGNAIDSAIKDPTAGTAGLRTLGTGAQQAAAGNDSRFLTPPAGALLQYAGSAEPSGWLMCNGQAVSRATYATLFAIVSTTYGVGDGSTTFNVPDLRGRVPVGLDNMGGASDAGRLSVANTLGTSGGEELHTLTTAELASHNHTQNAHHHLSSGAGVLLHTAGDIAVNGGGLYPITAAGAYDTGDTTATNNTAGSGTAHNNMQPYLLLNYIIKT